MNDEHANDTMTPQQTASDGRLESLQAALMQQVSDESLPSGILLLTNSFNEELDALDGSAGASRLNQLEWLNLYYALSSSATRPLASTGEDIAQEATAFAAEGIVPIYIADFVYRRVRPRWFAYVRRALDAERNESAAAAQLSEMTEEAHAFFGSAQPPLRYDLFTPLPGQHYGKLTKFVVPQTAFKSNTGRSIVGITIDFGDGGGAQAAPDEVIEHEFTDYGRKHIDLTVALSDGSSQRASLELEIAAAAPVPNEIWEFKESSGKVAATAWVYYANVAGRTKLEKPVLLAEGFPGGRTLDQLWPLVNQSGFVDELRRKGRDFVILGFADGTRRIQENGGYYAACVQRIIDAKKNGEKIAAGGASMGGLIARFALCRMEHGSDHQVGLFFTIDTPHEGANIPVSVQAFAQLYAAQPCGEAARPSATQLASPAAQQMLLQWIPPRSQWVSGRLYPVESPERKTFLEDLRRFGWMPRKVGRRIGVADGTANGTGNGVPSGVHALWFELSIFHWANLWASQEGTAQIVDMQNWEQRWTWRAGGRRIDGAPGGTRDSWGEAARNLPGRWSNPHPNHCFVPSVSACAIKTHDLYAGNLEQLPSDLDAFKTSPTNRAHVDLPADLKDFLVEEILKI